RIAVPAQIGADHGEAVEQSGRDFAPHLCSLRITMEQHHRGPLPADPRVDAHAVGADSLLLHAGHESHGGASSECCVLLCDGATAPESREAGLSAACWVLRAAC